MSVGTWSKRHFYYLIFMCPLECICLMIYFYTLQIFTRDIEKEQEQVRLSAKEDLVLKDDDLKDFSDSSTERSLSDHEILEKSYEESRGSDFLNEVEERQQKMIL